MSDDVRHGRKSLHPMSNRSADQVAAAGDCCRARIDRIGDAQAFNRQRDWYGAGKRCQGACRRTDRPTRSCLCPVAAQRSRTTSQTRCRPWTGVGDLRVDAGAHSLAGDAAPPRPRARRAQARRRCPGCGRSESESDRPRRPPDRNSNSPVALSARSISLAPVYHFWKELESRGSRNTRWRSRIVCTMGLSIRGIACSHRRRIAVPLSHFIPTSHRRLCPPHLRPPTCK